MRSYFILFLFTFRFTGGCSAQDGFSIASENLKYTVRLETKDSLGNILFNGTGFIIANGMIATNLQAICGASIVNAISVSKKSIPVKGILALDTLTNLILLSAKTERSDTVPFAEDNYPIRGETVYALYNPIGFTGKLTQGKTDSTHRFKQSPMLSLDIPPLQGGTGAPVFSSKGEFLGILIYHFIKGKNIAFVIPAKRLQNLLSLESKKTSPLNPALKEVRPLYMNEDDEVWLDVARSAMHEGSIVAQYEFIKKNLQYPLFAAYKHIKGKVIIGVVVDDKGQIERCWVEKSVHPLLDEESLRVTKLMKFTPALGITEKPIRSKIFIPYFFGVDE